MFKGILLISPGDKSDINLCYPESNTKKKFANKKPSGETMLYEAR